MTEWAQPWWWIGLIPVICLVLFQRHPRMAFSSFALIRTRSTFRMVLAGLPKLLFIVGLGLLLTALARPQESEVLRQTDRDGLDIMLVVDTSGSMQARDFAQGGSRLTRLNAAKEVIREFIAARPDDRIGMVVFGEEAFNQVPLTSDHLGMDHLLRLVDIGVAGAEGTAVGDAMSIAGQRLDQLDAPSKVMILLTDGRSNMGLDPIRVAEALSVLNIKVYTIGVGAKQSSSPSLLGLMGRNVEELDEATLISIANATGGAYFRAHDMDSLSGVYAQIDELEPSTAEVREFHHTNERYHPWLIAALILLLLQQLLAQTWLRRLP